MPPGCSTNRNQTAGLPSVVRFSQSPTTVGSAARAAAGGTAARLQTPTRPKPPVLLSRLEILPIAANRLTSTESDAQSPHNMAVSRKEAAILRLGDRTMACRPIELCGHAAGTHSLQRYYEVAIERGVRLRAGTPVSIEVDRTGGMPRPHADRHEVRSANVPIQHCPEQPARGCDRHRPGVPFRAGLSRFAAGDALPRSTMRPTAGRPSRSSTAIAGSASTCSAPGRTSA